MYKTTTHNITVSVMPDFLTNQSLPEANVYCWAYHIIIENNNEQNVQLLRRSWRIIDENGIIKTVNGTGVVGTQPIIQPGESFGYTSGVQLETPSGMMTGIYLMAAGDGEILDIEIPSFSLDSPMTTLKPN